MPPSAVIVGTLEMKSSHPPPAGKHVQQSEERIPAGILERISPAELQRSPNQRAAVVITVFLCRGLFFFFFRMTLLNQPMKGPSSSLLSSETEEKEQGTAQSSSLI